MSIRRSMNERNSTHILKGGFFCEKNQKALALSLALAMGLSLVACGDKDDSTTESKSSEATSEAASSEDASSEEASSEDASRSS